MVIPWATDRRTGGSMRVKGVAGNKRARRIEVEGAYNSRAIEGGQVGNKRAQWIEVEAEIGWVIDKFPTHRADRIKAPSVAPRRGRVEARPAPAANEALPAWEVPEAAEGHGGAADGGGRRRHDQGKIYDL